MDAEALAQAFLARQRPPAGVATRGWDAIFEAVFAFYEEDRADGWDPATGHDRLLFRWGPAAVGGEAFFEIDLTREVLGFREPEGEWVFSQTFRYLLSGAFANFNGGTLTCSSPEEMTGFRRRVVESPVYRVARAMRPAGASVCYGPADLYRRR